MKQSHHEWANARSGLFIYIKDKPVVTYCTGGIRCEKAAILLERAGFSDVRQLEGGILQYFERCGAKHYQGGCFVFDERVTVQAEKQKLC